MAATLHSRVEKLEDNLKKYLYDGSASPLWSLIESKTKQKRERIALGSIYIYIISKTKKNAFFILNFIPFYI